MTPEATAEWVPGPLRHPLAHIEAPALVAVGILTFVTGYVVTALVVLVGPSRTASDPVAVILQLGLIFYSAHLVPANLSGGDRFNWLQDVMASPADPNVPVIVFYAIPMVLLVVTGILAVRAYATNRLDPRQMLFSVAFVAGGYGLMAVLGTFVIEASLQGQTARPDLFLAAVFGLAFPLVFGAIGAGLANIIESLRDLELF